jgi:2-polyprenyl-3-methyl-5-hydroxy-6-metoxy-1,4-benzoquinol methylase
MSARTPTRLDADREFWDTYARRWTPAVGDRNPYLGDEWSGPQDVIEVVERYIEPFIGPDAVVGELGSGGGRLAVRVGPRVKELHCLDISEEMLRRAGAAMRDQPNVRFHLMTSQQLPDSLPRFDFMYAFDVLVHLDLHSIWAYLNQLVAGVRVGGHVLVHTTNLLTDPGWARFAGQPAYTIRGHYFVCPQLVDALLAHLPVEVVLRSTPGSGNFYEDRDDLVVLRRIGGD